MKQRRNQCFFHVIILLTAALSFSIVPQASAQATDATTAEADRLQALATPVATITLQMEDTISVERRFLGRLEARQSADIGFEFGGIIDTIPVREGDRVQKDHVLATLVDDALLVERVALSASLSAAQTQYDFTEAEAERVRQLVARGAAQSARLDQIESERDTLAARLVEVESHVNQVDLRLRAARVTAPFDGIIGARSASLGETVAAGQPVVTIFDSGAADFRVGLPTSLDPADLRNTRITIGDADYTVTLNAVRPDIDYRTNTRTAIFGVEADALVSFGLSAVMTGEVSLPMRGAWVPVDAMRPSSEGYWIILEVDDDMIANRVAIEVQHLRDDMAFVIGAFDTGTRIVSAGAHKVVPGQTVSTD